MEPGLVIASNRGPLSYVVTDDGLAVAHGGGGLVSALGPLVKGTGATWVAAAMSAGDRVAAGRGVADIDGYRYRCLAVDPGVYRMAYDDISNLTLWPLHHRLWDLARQPDFGSAWRRSWAAYQEFNDAFAAAIAEDAPEGAAVLVQDYHLSMVGPVLAERRPDLRLVHFAHTPFCSAEDIRVLPPDVRTALLSGLAAHGACGFHTRRWADAFEGCCEEVLGYRPQTYVAPLAPDRASFDPVLASPECTAAARALQAEVGDRLMVLRVDRIEPSKNLLRGFAAFEEMLRAHPELVGEVVFVALVYPSRVTVHDYVVYREDVERLVDRINDEWSTPSWTPIILDTRDDFPRSVAALQRYDALLVNPIRDWLNLVAKEGPLLNQNDGVVLLSREAGAWDELADAVLSLEPFDVLATAQQLAAALSMSRDERRRLSTELRTTVARRTPADWLDDQLAAAAADHRRPAGASDHRPRPAAASRQVAQER